MRSRTGSGLIQVWDAAGEGQPRDLPGTSNTILHLIPCGDGIAIGAFDPAIGIFAADGTRHVWKDNVQADLRDMAGNQFAVSACQPGSLRPQVGWERPCSLISPPIG